MKRLMRTILCLAICGAFTVTAAQTSTVEETPEVTATPAPIEYLTPNVLNTYPHDPDAFTQGLLLHDGYLYESAGLEGESDLRKVELETGEVIQQVDQAPEIFSEGLALVDDQLIQLTWKHETAFVYNLDTFEQLDTFSYAGEGWGLCYDGDALWLSDGTDILTAYDPQTFEVVEQVRVTYQGYSVAQVGTPNGRTLASINELECVGGLIYANVWYTDYILRIDSAGGQVTGVIDASNLLTPDERAALDSGAVLNGIAYNPENDTFYLTGKHWPKLFEVQFVVSEVVG
jgi:glutaminyl-peptide cyclotransferase